MDDKNKNLVHVLLVSTNEDFIACKNYCQICFEQTLKMQVLRAFPVLEHDLMSWESMRYVKLTTCQCLKKKQ